MLQHPHQRRVRFDRRVSRICGALSAARPRRQQATPLTRDPQQNLAARRPHLVKAGGDVRQCRRGDALVVRPSVGKVKCDGVVQVQLMGREGKTGAQPQTSRATRPAVAQRAVLSVLGGGDGVKVGEKAPVCAYIGGGRGGASRFASAPVVQAALGRGHRPLKRVEGDLNSASAGRDRQETAKRSRSPHPMQKFDGSLVLVGKLDKGEWGPGRRRSTTTRS